MRELKTLHLASFSGNTGDGAMHDGAYRTRAADCGFSFRYEPLELREFVHWNERRFDESFIEMANSFDCVLIGGNSIFQMWRDNTASGTYFDFAPDYLTAIERPMIFYGIGCDATRGVSEIAMPRFRAFVDAMLGTGRTIFSLRNDGSQEIIRHSAGDAYADAMTVIPDGGLFAEPGAAPPRNGRYVVVNLAGDMPEIRYGAEASGTRFSREVADCVNKLMHRHPDIGVVFVPHIHSDIAVIASVIAGLDDRLRRTRVEIGPYLVDPAGWSQVFSLYRGAMAVLAMRFHASLVPLGLGVPTTGLSSHHKVAGLYAGLGLDDRCHSIERDDVESGVALAFDQLSRDVAADNGGTARGRQLDAREVERKHLADHHHDLSNWLDRVL